MKEMVYQQLTAKGFTVTDEECEIIAARLNYAHTLKEKAQASTLNEAQIALNYNPKERAGK